METVILERSSRPSRTRAERKAGELLGQLERNEHGGDRRSSSFQPGILSEYRAVLTDSDIAPTTAHRWQSLDLTKVYLCRAIAIL